MFCLPKTAWPPTCLVAKTGEGTFKPGNVCIIDAYSEADVYSVKAGTAVTDEFILVTEPFIDYTGFDEEKDFAVAEGKRFRGHRIGKDSIITVAKADLANAGTIAKGDKVEAGVSKQLGKVASYTTGATMKFEVVALTSFFDIDAVQLRKIS